MHSALSPSSPMIITLKPIKATPESFAPFGQVISASSDSDRERFGPQDAQLELHRGVPRLNLREAGNWLCFPTRVQLVVISVGSEGQVQPFNSPLESHLICCAPLLYSGCILKKLDWRLIHRAFLLLLWFYPAKYPDYVDAYLRLAGMAKAQNNIQLSIELINDALRVDDRCFNALSMLGDLELMIDDWIKAKETLRAAKDATDGKDSYSTLALGNWNYFAAVRNEKRGPKLEAQHLEKAKELYTKVLMQHTSNLYAANGSAIVLAEKGQFDVAKDIFTQVQEAASGTIFVQMPDVWVNLAHVYFAQGHFALAAKMYQNCLRKFYYNTDTQVLLYLARTQYEAEQWQECKRTLLRAIHLAPSNYTLRFDAGVAMQKFSASTLQKSKRTADEVRSTVSELKNAVRVFSHLAAVSSYHVYGFDEKKRETHVEYCKHLLEVAKVHCEAAEAEEQQNRQRLEAARQISLAEEAQRKAEEQRKYLMEKRKQEDELKQVMQQEEYFERIKEQLKNPTNTSAKRRERERSHGEDEEAGDRKRRRGGGGRKRKEKKTKTRFEEEAEMEYGHDDNEEDTNTFNYYDDDGTDKTQNDLTAAGLEDSDVEDDQGGNAAINRKRRALSESDDDDEPLERPRGIETDDEAEGTKGKGGSGDDEEDVD